MKCNFKQKLRQRKNTDFVAAFQKAFVDGDFKDLIAPEAMEDSLRLLLKNQSQLCG